MALQPPPPATFYKKPSAVKDYGFDLGAKPPPGELPCLEADETVVALTVTTSDPSLVVNSTSIDTNDRGVLASQLTAWLSGGGAAPQYEVSYLYTTSKGRTDQLTAKIIMI